MTETAAMKIATDSRDGDVRHQRISVETRQQRPRRSERNRQDQPNREVDPEQITGQKLVHFIALNDGLPKAI